MDFKVNGNKWIIIFVRPNSHNLMRSNGTYTLGVCDNNEKCIYISNNLSDKMTDKVLCHELCHVFSFEYGYNMDIQTEEIVADFMSLYGRDIIYLADEIMSKFIVRIA